MSKPYYTDPPGGDRTAFITELFRKLSEDEDPGASASRFARALRGLFGKQGLASISTRNLKPGQYRIMRLLHQDGVADEGYTDTFFAGPGAPVQRGGIIGDMIAKGVPTVLRNESVRDDLVLGNQLSPYGLIAFLPVFQQGVPSNWAIVMHTDSDSITEDDIEQWMFVSNLSGMVTSTKAHSKNLREASTWIQREVDEIASIQKGLLPSQMPVIEGLQMAALCETFDRAGGDYYDIFRTPSNEGEDGTWVIFIADASGHGPSAAVIVAMISILLHSYHAERKSAAGLMEHLNSCLKARWTGFTFVTAFMGILDPKTRRMRYVNAGHPPPILLKQDTTLSYLETTEGYPLCIAADVRYEEKEIEFQLGDLLFLYTDGITEAMSPARAPFAEKRLELALNEAGTTAQEVIDIIAERVRSHEGGGRPLDDQTMFAIRF